MYHDRGVDETKALKQARAISGPDGMDIAKVVSCDRPYEWNEGEWRLGHEYQTQRNPRFHVIALNFGIKRNMLRKLAQRRCRITVVPAQTGADEILALQPDGVFLSNGPGDPGTM